MEVVDQFGYALEVYSEPFFGKHWVRKHFHRESAFDQRLCFFQEFRYCLCAPFRPVQPALPPQLHASGANAEFFLWKMVKVQGYPLNVLSAQFFDVVQNFCSILGVCRANKIEWHV